MTNLQDQIGEDFWTEGYRQGRHDAQADNPYNERDYGDDYADGYRIGWASVLLGMEE